MLKHSRVDTMVLQEVCRDWRPAHKKNLKVKFVVAITVFSFIRVSWAVSIPTPNSSGVPGLQGLLG